MEGYGARREERIVTEVEHAESAAFEIRVVGELGPLARQVFADLDVDVEPTATVLSAVLTQQDLHAVLDRVRSLGLELVDVRQAPVGAGGA